MRAKLFKLTTVVAEVEIRMRQGSRSDGRSNTHYYTDTASRVRLARKSNGDEQQWQQHCRLRLARRADPVPSFSPASPTLNEAAAEQSQSNTIGQSSPFPAIRSLLRPVDLPPHYARAYGTEREERSAEGWNTMVSLLRF